MENALVYDRLQFAFTVIFHYLFPQPLSRYVWVMLSLSSISQSQAVVTYRYRFLIPRHSHGGTREWTVCMISRSYRRSAGTRLSS